MDVLNVGEKTFVKASVIAKDLGYTADYVGQLCRSGKVDAQLVGRSWYVERDSISNHKGNRYRSTQAKSVKALKINHTQESKIVSESLVDTSHFYIHNTLKPVSRYVPDETELFPTVSKKEKMHGHLNVGLADSKSVEITSESPKYNFDTPELPKIKFKGLVSITEVDESKTILGEGEISLHPKEVEKLTVKKTAKNIVILPTKDVKTVSSKETHVLVDLEGPSVVTAEVTETQVSAQSGSSLSIFVSMVASFAIVAVLFGLELHLSASGQAVMVSYVFNVDNLVAAVALSL